MTTPKLPIELRKAWHVLLQNGRCAICGEALFIGSPAHRIGSFSFEHKLPRVHGGKDNRANLAGTHNECNKHRKDRVQLKFSRPTYEANPRRPEGWGQTKRVQRTANVWWSRFALPVTWGDGDGSVRPDRSTDAGDATGGDTRA